MIRKFIVSFDRVFKNTPLKFNLNLPRINKIDSRNRETEI